MSLIEEEKRNHQDKVSAVLASSSKPFLDCFRASESGRSSYNF